MAQLQLTEVVRGQDKREGRFIRLAPISIVPYSQHQDYGLAASYGLPCRSYI